MHEFIRLNPPEPLDIYRSSLFVNPMIAVGIVVQNFIQFLKLEVLELNPINIH